MLWNDRRSFPHHLGRNKQEVLYSSSDRRCTHNRSPSYHRAHRYSYISLCSPLAYTPSPSFLIHGFFCFAYCLGLNTRIITDKSVSIRVVICVYPCFKRGLSAWPLPLFQISLPSHKPHHILAQPLSFPPLSGKSLLPL